MAAKASMIVAFVCLAGLLLSNSRALARGDVGFHGGGTWDGHGGQMNVFPMHGSPMGRHDRGERERADERDRHGRRRDRLEHRRDHNADWHTLVRVWELCPDIVIGRDGPRDAVSRCSVSLAPR